MKGTEIERLSWQRGSPLGTWRCSLRSRREEVAGVVSDFSKRFETPEDAHLLSARCATDHKAKKCTVRMTSYQTVSQNKQNVLGFTVEKS